jgi:large subunit ribosomal protein L15
MHLNTLKPANGARKTKVRVGRGIGCGLGKTCGRGHKGQTARSGYSKKLGFEGGQVPLQRRLPKYGFKSPLALVSAEIRLSDLVKVVAERIGLKELKEANIVKNSITRAKVILSGKIDKAVTLYGLGVTAGARKVIEQLGGKVE